MEGHGFSRAGEKIKIMGPTVIKLLIGTRLGSRQVRAPKDKLSRIRSGIHKLRTELVAPEDEERYILGLVGQLRFIDQLCPRDVSIYARELNDVCKGRALDSPSRRFLASPR